MTQNEQGAYGLQWPRWYVYWRGRMWLAGKYGSCPNCYSSPPNKNCFVCKGTYDYGPKLHWGRKRVWLNRWNDMRRKERR